jgi:hypothetical protein
MKPRKIVAALAALSLAWSMAFAQSGPTETPEIPTIIILEIQPTQPGEHSQMPPIDQAMVETLLMQLLATLEAEGSLPQDHQIIVPTPVPGIGI